MIWKKIPLVTCLFVGIVSLNYQRNCWSFACHSPNSSDYFVDRILKMMHTIASNSSENRMGPSAVAACMAPLILRPLLAGECELDDDYDTAGDVSAQLLAAANAANNAQAIVTTLLEEYENIFDVRFSLFAAVYAFGQPF